MLGVGGWQLARGRAGISRTEGAAPGAWRRLGLGMAMAGVGYHVVAWSLPRAWMAFAVPPERWWIVAGVAAVTVAGTWRMDGDVGGAGG